MSICSNSIFLTASFRFLSVWEKNNRIINQNYFSEVIKSVRGLEVGVICREGGEPSGGGGGGALGLRGKTAVRVLPSSWPGPLANNGHNQHPSPPSQ